MTTQTAPAPDSSAPQTKYGAKILECQPGTMLMPKSQPTIVCSETKTGMIMTVRMPNSTFSRRHSRSVPRQPSARTVYRNRRQPKVRSRRVAKSGTIPENQKMTLVIRYTPDRRRVPNQRAFVVRPKLPLIGIGQIK